MVEEEIKKFREINMLEDIYDVKLEDLVVNCLP